MRDLEVRARNALPQVCQLRITIEDFQGNQETDVVANLGAAEHADHEPSAEYLRWEVAAQAVRLFWLLAGPKLRDRPEAWP
eukprot:4114872-Amphidinium_carterae.1